MKKDPSHEKIWIVKASDTILGPFTLEELAKAVRTKHVGLLDEARTPSDRWRFVRDVPELQLAISELVNQDETVENTQTASRTQLTATHRIDDDKTPIPIPTPIKPVETVRSNAEPPPIAPESHRSGIRSYGVQKPREPLPILKILIGVFVTAIIVVGAVLFVEKQSWQREQKKSWAQFQKLHSAKLYHEAYNELKKVQMEYPDQPSALTRAGFLFLNPGRELVKAKRLFERSSRLDPTNKELMIQNLNGQGLVAMYDGQESQSRAFFDRALTLEPGNWMTRLNLISLATVQKRWGDAYNISQQLISDEPNRAYLIQASLVVLADQHRDKASQVLSGLLKTLDHSSHLRPERRLMAIRLATQINDHATLQTEIGRFFEDLPSLQIQFSDHLTVDQRWQDWNILYNFCSEITGPEKLEAEILALQVVCISQVQKWTEAEEWVTEGLKRFQNHPTLLLAQLHMLTSMGRWPEVRALMRHQVLSNQKAASWMFAKSCLEEKNYACVGGYLNPLAQNSYVSTPVYVLRANMQCRENLFDDCRFSISQGLSQDPLAAGLLRTRYNLEESL